MKMGELINKLEEIDSKLSEVSNAVQDLYISLDAENDLEEREELIGEAIAKITGNDDEEFIQTYMEVLRNLEVLFE